MRQVDLSEKISEQESNWCRCTILIAFKCVNFVWWVIAASTQILSLFLFSLSLFPTLYLSVDSITHTQFAPVSSLCVAAAKKNCIIVYVLCHRMWANSSENSYFTWNIEHEQLHWSSFVFLNVLIVFLNVYFFLFFRRMFPTLRVSFSGPLRFNQPADRYAVLLDIVPTDVRRYRYAYHRSQWLVAGKADPPPPPRLYPHPDSPISVDVLRKQVVSFEKVKLTNNEMDKNGQV